MWLYATCCLTNIKSLGMPFIISAHVYQYMDSVLHPNSSQPFFLQFCLILFVIIITVHICHRQCVHGTCWYMMHWHLYVLHIICYIYLNMYFSSFFCFFPLFSSTPGPWSAGLVKFETPAIVYLPGWVGRHKGPVPHQAPTRWQHHLECNSFPCQQHPRLFPSAMAVHATSTQLRREWRQSRDSSGTPGESCLEWR